MQPARPHLGAAPDADHAAAQSYSPPQTQPQPQPQAHVDSQQPHVDSDASSSPLLAQAATSESQLDSPPSAAPLGRDPMRDDYSHAAHYCLHEPLCPFHAHDDPSFQTGPNHESQSNSSNDSHTWDQPFRPDSPPEPLFWTFEPKPLSSAFADVKHSIVARQDPAALHASWSRLLVALRAEVDEIERLGPDLVPSIEHADLVGSGGGDEGPKLQFAKSLLRYGVAVVRGVVPHDDIENAMLDTADYIEAESEAKTAGPTVWDRAYYSYYWTPAQVRVRAHASVLDTQRVLMSLWKSASTSTSTPTPTSAAQLSHRRRNAVAARLPITYADRLRVHGSMLRPARHGSTTSRLRLPKYPLVRCDDGSHDWLAALHTSCLVGRVDDGGGSERWLPGCCRRYGPYSAVLRGAWESWDPWDFTMRVDAGAAPYHDDGARSASCMFQGMVALSTVEPGAIRVLPSPKLATAYCLLRPFFQPIRSLPRHVSLPLAPLPPASSFAGSWGAYLDPANWELCPQQDAVLHGLTPGASTLRVVEAWHPHLELHRSMISLPTLQAGDYVVWHPDVAYNVSRRNVGIARRPNEATVLVYVPAAPLTLASAQYLARQRAAFRRAKPGPDLFGDSDDDDIDEDEEYDGSNWYCCGRESHADDVGAQQDMEIYGGADALRAMGLAPWVAREDEDEDAEERDLIEAANAILFPGAQHEGDAVPGLLLDDELFGP